MGPGDALKNDPELNVDEKLTVLLRRASSNPSTFHLGTRRPAFAGWVQEECRHQYFGG